MKKYLIILMAALAFLVSCGQENLLPEDEMVQQTPVTFNLTANHPDATKAVKTGWEAGDAIFVFFTGVDAPKHLKMTYDGTKWSSTEYNGSMQTDGALGLTEGKTGTMRAVFLPFGSDATVSADGTSFVFSTTYYAYYLTATLDYNVTDNKVSGAFNMSIPEGYVQFFIEDGDATNGAYTLGTDAVIPVGVASISANGTITETDDKTAADDMLGYVYENNDTKGYIFSGKLVDGYNYKDIEDRFCYYFAKIKTEGGSRTDLFVKPDNALASHAAVKLPDNDSDRWIPVGEGIAIDMGSEYGGLWASCNLDATAPEDLGSKKNWDDANTAGTLPSALDFVSLNNAKAVWISIHGKEGMVFKGWQTNGFLFFPKVNDDENTYWSSTEFYEGVYYCLSFDSGGSGCSQWNERSKVDEWGVRFLQN